VESPADARVHASFALAFLHALLFFVYAHVFAARRAVSDFADHDGRVGFALDYVFAVYGVRENHFIYEHGFVLPYLPAALRAPHGMLLASTQLITLRIKRYLKLLPLILF